MQKTVLLSLSLLCICVTCWALPSDNKQLIHINSDRLVVHYNQHKATYEKQVTLQQGSRHLSGDRLVLKQNKQSQVKHITLYGNPAKGHYQQDVGGPITYTRAKEMIYQPLIQYISFKNDAWVNQGGNIFKGPLITYNLEDKTVTTPTAQTGSNEITLQPYDTIKAKDGKR